MNDIELQGEKILKVLYNTHYNPFNDETIPTSLRLLSRAIELDEKRTADICDYLVRERWIDKVLVGVHQYFKINGTGIQHMESQGYLI